MRLNNIQLQISPMIQTQFCVGRSILGYPCNRFLPFLSKTPRQTFLSSVPHHVGEGIHNLGIPRLTILLSVRQRVGKVSPTCVYLCVGYGCHLSALLHIIPVMCHCRQGREIPPPINQTAIFAPQHPPTLLRNSLYTCPPKLRL